MTDGNACPFPGCGKPVANLGLCAGHYKQKQLGKELKPLRPLGQSAGRVCVLPACDAEMDSTLLCTKHYGQKAKTTLTPHEFIEGVLRQCGTCPYCLEPLGAAFEIDHFHGDCEHPKNKRMCHECMRGMIHRECNEELKWVEQALAAGNIAELAPHVGAYLAGRPFLVVAA